MKNIFDDNLDNKISKLGFDETEVIKIVYGMKLIFTDLSKIIILLLVSILFDQFYNFIWISLFTATLRMKAGGFHLKSYRSCLLFAGLYYIVLIYLTSFSIGDAFILPGILAVLIILKLAPKIPIERHKLKGINKKKLKLQATFIASLLVFLFIIKNNPMTTIGLWVVIIQSLLLLSEEGFLWLQSQLKKLTPKF